MTAADDEIDWGIDEETLARARAWSAKQLQAMREWLADCSWSDISREKLLDPEVVSDWTIQDAVAANYAGGLTWWAIDHYEDEGAEGEEA